jgi:hypothetical protein
MARRAQMVRGFEIPDKTAIVGIRPAEDGAGTKRGDLIDALDRLDACSFGG